MVLCAAPPHRVQGEQHAQGIQLLPCIAGKQHCWEKGRAEHEHRVGAVAPLGSAREEKVEKCWAWVYFHLGTPSST